MIDVTSGRPLSEFEGSDSYPYREALSRRVDELLPALQAVAPWVLRKDLNAALDTCMDLDRGVPDAQGAVVDNAQIRFARRGNRPSGEQARQLVAVCLRFLDR